MKLIKVKTKKNKILVEMTLEEIQLLENTVPNYVGSDVNDSILNDLSHISRQVEDIYAMKPRRISPSDTFLMMKHGVGNKYKTIRYEPKDSEYRIAEYRNAEILPYTSDRPGTITFKFDSATAFHKTKKQVIEYDGGRVTCMESQCTFEI